MAKDTAWSGLHARRVPPGLKGALASEDAQEPGRILSLAKTRSDVVDHRLQRLPTPAATHLHEPCGAMPVRALCSQTRSSSGCPGSGATCPLRKGRTHERLSIQAAPRLGLRRGKSGASSLAGLAHAGHMRLENPRGDSWNRGPDRAPKTRAKSQDRGDSCTLLKLRGWRTASLPRRRSPVRTRCSAPLNVPIWRGFSRRSGRGA